jgi:hypothetical protein
MVVDGVDVTSRATVEGTRISYVPAEDLAAGEHHVRVTVTDARGRALVKRWSFTVAPEAESFVAPTPPNGGILRAQDLPASVAVRAAAPVELAVSIDGGPFVPLGARARFAGGVTRAELPELRAGTCTVRAGADRYTSFSVDPDPPSLESVRVDPPVLRQPGPVTVDVRAADRPFGEVRSVEVVVRLGERVIERLSERPADGLARFEWTPGRLEAGRYALEVELADWAGNTARGAAALEVTAECAEAASREVSLRLDRLPPQTEESRPTVTGSATPGTEVELFVNGRSQGRARTAGASGEFTFRRVELEPGRNRISAIAEEPVGGRRSREQTMTTTLTAEPGGIAAGAAPAAPGTRARARVGAPAAAASRPPAPVLTHPPKDQKVGGGRIAVGGESLPDAEVTVYVDGRPQATVTANAAGRFNVPQVELAAGPNRITARARTAAGEGPASETVTVTYEKKK